MIAYLLRNWKLLLDLVLVVAGIIVFTLVDPFGMFSKRELKGTANIVSSVKDIGELVTAEYYGEVISSLNETQVFDIKPDTVSELFEDCLYEIIDLCIDKVNANRDLNYILKKLEPIKAKYNKENHIYNHLIVLAAYHEFDPKINKYYNTKQQRFKGGVERKIIEKIVAQIKQIKRKHSDDSMTLRDNLNAFLYYVPSYMQFSADFHYKLNEEAQSNKEKKRDIVFIGRGWVKAGYKFNKLDENNFAYNALAKRITFYGLSPVVLDKDINPWFIPEKKIEGFQLVDFYKDATFEEAKRVKIKCKEKLLEQARKAGIMNQAQKNGEEALRSFFVLLLNEPELKVKFEPIPNQNEYNIIAADTIVTVNEALIIDSILNVYNRKIEQAISPQKEALEQQLSIFYKQLCKLNFIDSTQRFNIFSVEAANVLEHKYYILYADYKEFMQVRDTLRWLNKKKNESIYTKFTMQSAVTLKYPNFIQSFNKTLECIDKQINKAIYDSNLTIGISKRKLNALATKIVDADSISYTPSNKIVNGDTIFILERKSKFLPYSFSDLAFANYKMNLSFTKNSFQDSDLIKRKLDSLITTIDYETGNVKFDSLRKIELDSVIVPYEYNKAYRAVSLKPIRNFINFVKKPM